MNDYKKRFAASLAIAFAGVAGLTSMLTGALVMTAILRAALAAGLFYIIGSLLATLLYDGSINKPSIPPELDRIQHPDEEKEAPQP